MKITNAALLELNVIINSISNAVLPISKTLIKAKKEIEPVIESILDEQKKIFNEFAYMGENDEVLGIVGADGKRIRVTNSNDIDWKDQENGLKRYSDFMTKGISFSFKFEADDCKRKVLDEKTTPSKEIPMGDMLERKLSANTIVLLEDWKIIKNYL